MARNRVSWIISAATLGGMLALSGPPTAGASRRHGLLSSWVDRPTNTISVGRVPLNQPLVNRKELICVNVTY